ncbi:hypothetical protein PFICI_04433 [Pestalotiopsis fici W106-1]|uniref:Uncharacterized protein n=1 Tax=Pestalotiopsis fici (strain W106-1 / CGMCC3.15140) TaxID=1229662 RepID=W3XAU1_PESFW|nr:uncharacterized protein PFICI_04433 [Pestalotiopsis fici W106-1]ETS82557.1 hypothetical protein PFICI_04433 [Pestalotiopsis fici W106-1]
MASTLPEGALNKIVDSVKSLITPAKGTDTTKSAQSTSPAGTEKVPMTNTEQTLHMEEAAPVEHETVKRVEHEVVETIVNKDVHQDHYHRTVQPIKERVVLPTKHIYIETGSDREYDHRDVAATAEGSQRDAHRYPDEGRVEEPRRAGMVAPNQDAEGYVEERVRHVVTNETIIPPPIETTQHVHKTRHLAPGQQSATNTSKPGLDRSQEKSASPKDVDASEAH